MQTFQITIETVAHTSIKYKYDADARNFKVKKALPIGMVFPYHFGFIPGTIGEDGDPLDAMVISEHTSYTGANINCRLIGALLARQTEARKTFRNDRFFFIPTDSVLLEHISRLDEFGRRHNEQLKAFFVNYNLAENKKFTPIRIIPPEQAFPMLPPSIPEKN